MTTVLPDKLGRRRLSKLLSAHEAKLFQGTIPLFSDDREEQELLDATHARIERDGERASKRMCEHLDAQALEIVDLRERLAAATNDPRFPWEKAQ